MHERIALNGSETKKLVTLRCDLQRDDFRHTNEDFGSRAALSQG